MKNNCFFYALGLWVRRGGYLVVRKSRMGFFPHFIWCGDLKNAEVLHFSPDVPKNHAGKLFHKFWFKGSIKTNDQEPTKA